ncbi:MAG: hypothetical protein VB584_02895 [Candidatus Nitrosopelagicus sp.]|jgi:hypothetical protein|tara:strand:+ start:916 stop:1233 length:318 start_codon:yes stop_codon:yes gene_type:complete
METADIEAIPIIKTFDLKDEKDAYDAAEEMVRIGFYKEKKGFKVLMPRESNKTAKRIGYIVTTSVSAGLRKAGQERDIWYGTYYHDKEHYAIVLASSKVVQELGL